jgi:5-methyltetrahydropteroyltriglutamate--homocysteine methyltransferase
MAGGIRIEQIGSLTRPEYLLDARDAFKAGRASIEQLRAAEDRAVLEGLELQRSVGVDVYTDGEMRRDAWQTNFSEAVDGFVDDYPVRAITRPDGSTVNVEMHAKVVALKLRPTRRLVGIDAAFMTEHAPGTFKITMPGPSMVSRAGFQAGVTRDYESEADLRSDVAAIISSEMKQLVRDGVTYIQLDESFTNFRAVDALDRMRAVGLDPEQVLAGQIEAENACYDAARAEGRVMLGCHLCAGSRTAAEKRLSEPERDLHHYDWLVERIFPQVHADRFLFEWDNDWEALKYLPPGKVAVLGLVSSLDPTLESQDDLLRCIERASKYASLDQLALSTQCGFQGSGTRDGAHMTIDEQKRKLELIADTARKVWG